MRNILNFAIKVLFIISIILLFNFCCNTKKIPYYSYEADGIRFVEIVDTIYTKETISDTVWSIKEMSTKIDTFVMVKEKLKVKLITFYDTVTKDRILQVEGKCDTDTIYKEVKVPLPPNKKIMGLPEESFYTLCILFAILLIPFIILIILLKKVA